MTSPTNPYATTLLLMFGRIAQTALDIASRLVGRPHHCPAPRPRVRLVVTIGPETEIPPMPPTQGPEPREILHLRRRRIITIHGIGDDNEPEPIEDPVFEVQPDEASGVDTSQLVVLVPNPNGDNPFQCAVDSKDLSFEGLVINCSADVTIGAGEHKIVRRAIFDLRPIEASAIEAEIGAEMPIPGGGG